MDNIYEFFDKICIEIGEGINLGKVKNLLFSNRLKQVFYLKTENGYFVKINDILAINNCIIVKKYSTTICDDYIAISSAPILVDTVGNFKGKLQQIMVDKKGDLQQILVDNCCFTVKDIYNTGNDLIIMQSEKRKKPINNKIKNNKKEKNNKNKCKNKVKNNKNKDKNIEKTVSTKIETNAKIPTNITIVYPTKYKDIALSKIVNNCNAKIYRPASKHIVHYSCYKNTTKMPKKIICNCNMLVGREINEDIYLDNGKRLIEKNQVITKSTIKLASKYNKLVEVTCKI